LGADIWDRDYLDLCGPAMITITDHGRGEITFGALQAGLDIEYSRSSVGFTREGFDEMDEVSGDGSAKLTTTARSRSNSPFTTATKPSSKQNGRLLQQPARCLAMAAGLGPSYGSAWLEPISEPLASTSPKT
jgi:hypothetical protein